MPIVSIETTLEDIKEKVVEGEVLFKLLTTLLYRDIF